MGATYGHEQIIRSRTKALRCVAKTRVIYFYSLHSPVTGPQRARKTLKRWNTRTAVSRETTDIVGFWLNLDLLLRLQSAQHMFQVHLGNLM